MPSELLDEAIVNFNSFMFQLATGRDTLEAVVSCTCLVSPVVYDTVCQDNVTNWTAISMLQVCRI